MNSILCHFHILERTTKPHFDEGKESSQFDIDLGFGFALARQITPNEQRLACCSFSTFSMLQLFMNNAIES